MDTYLPIGSVVTLKGGAKRIMIFGREQKQVGTETMFDYIACPYPEGNLDPDHTYLFNHEQIDRVFFLGFQDDEELAFQDVLLDARRKREAGAQAAG